MSFVGSNILAGASGQGGAGYAIERSVRFNSADTPKITRTPSSAGNQKTWTLSFWMKRTTTGSREQILSAAGTHNTYVEFQNDKLMIEDHNPGLNFILKTTRVFRDHSSWYSVIISVDTTQATASNRIKLYINGVQETAFDSSTYPSQNYDTSFNDTGEHKFGQFPGNTTFPFNGYLADVHFIDGQALAPTDFGETDEFGVWQPKKFAGTYGTLVDQSQTWSSALADSSGSFASGYPATYAFDGITTAAQTARASASNTTTTFTPATDIVYTSKVEVWTYFGGSVSLNGGSAVTVTNDQSWRTIATGSGTLNTLTFTASASNVYLGGVRIDGKLLVDSGVTVTDNSFHLDFADNSSNAALGTDTSGVSPANTWTVNNLTASVGAPTDAIAFDGDDKLTFSGPGSITGDCTIECFIKAASYAGSHKRIISADEASQSTQFTLIRSYNNRLYFIFGDSGDSVTNNFVAPSTNEWHHIAMTRSGTTVSYFMDGTRLGTSSHTGGTINITSTVLAWGYGSEYFTGEISNARIVDGQALYTGSTYTVPTADLTTTSQGATSSYVTHLLANTSTVTANGGTGSAGTAGGNPAAVTASPFGDPANIDSLVDTPTNVAEPTDTGAGGEVAGNYATLNPLQNINNDTFSDGNLKVSTSGGNYSVQISTIATPLTGKWYAEVLIASTSGYDCISIVPSDATLTSTSWGQNIPNAVAYGAWNGSIFKNTSSVATGATFTTNDIIGIAYDADNSTVVFYKNNVAQPTVTSVAAKQFFFASSDYDASASGVYIWNFGQRAFANTNVPSGYKSLNTANLPDPTIADGSKYFDTKLYTGNGGTQSITMDNSALSPDFVWIKCRNDAIEHQLFDSVRGVLKSLRSDNNSAEATVANSLTAFNSNGFSLGSAQSVNHTKNYAAWAWDAGSSNTTIAAGGLNSSVYDQSQNWTSGWISEATGNSGDTFDGIFGANGQGGSNYLVWSPASAVSYSDALGGVEVYTSTNNSGYNNWAYKVNPTSTSYSSSAPSDLSSFISPYEINSGVQSGWTKISTGDGSLTSVGMWNKNASESGIYMNGLKVNGKILVDSGVTPTNVPSVASTVRANPSAGFSIVSWTGTGANGTVGHGLGAQPEFIIIKNRSSSLDWLVGHVGIGLGSGRLLLNSGDPNSNAGASSYWNNTAGTSSVFSIGSHTVPNKSGDNIIAYCFAPVANYSSMGSYSSGSDPFVFTGFSPRFVLLKKTNAAGHWYMFDSERGPINPNETWLEANGSGAEQTHANGDIRFLSNGFQPIGSDIDAGGGTYIYYAVSEHPFKTARAR